MFLRYTKLSIIVEIGLNSICRNCVRVGNQNLTKVYRFTVHGRSIFDALATLTHKIESSRGLQYTRFVGWKYCPPPFQYKKCDAIYLQPIGTLYSNTRYYLRDHPNKCRTSCLLLFFSDVIQPRNYLFLKGFTVKLNESSFLC